MAASQQRRTIEQLIRFVRVPHERAARVKAVIHRSWRRELRRTRFRHLLMFAVLVVAAVLMAAMALRWVEAWVP